jgi:hypothetical protein
MTARGRVEEHGNNDPHNWMDAGAARIRFGSMRTHRIVLPAVSRHPISDPMILILYTTLNVGWNARVLAFDSGPVQPGTMPPQSYP